MSHNSFKYSLFHAKIQTKSIKGFNHKIQQNLIKKNDDEKQKHENVLGFNYQWARILACPVTCIILHKHISKNKKKFIICKCDALKEYINKNITEKQ